MRSMNSSVETVNAAATAIVSAEAREQPASVTKRRWGSCLSLYWCFRSHKNSKRISHAVLVPQPVVPVAAVSAAENSTSSAAIILPFIAPPSSPASFLQSDPPSATQSPAGLFSLASLSVSTYSPGGHPSIFAIGPYAYETQLVSPPVFSAFTTEPSTAPFTPPPEAMQFTTPSSPEVPFAQLLSSSGDRSRRNIATDPKLALSHYDYQPYLLYPGSPGAHLISPGSVFSNSGTSSPFPDKHPIYEFRVGEAPGFWGFDQFTTRKWGSRLGSGSLTPDGAGLGSRLGSGTLTPNGVGMDSQLGSGCLKSDVAGPGSQDGLLSKNQIPAVASISNSGNGGQSYGNFSHHRVSFELTGEDVARCLANKSMVSTRTIAESPHDVLAESQHEDRGLSAQTGSCEITGESSTETTEKAPGVENRCYQRQYSTSLGSTKEFYFEQTKGEILDKPSEWWANEKVSVDEATPGNTWTFFPMLQPGVS